MAFYNVSCSSKNHVSLVRNDVVPALAHLGKSECKKYSIMTLANIAANVETRAAASRSGGLQTAIHMIKDADLDCRRYACIALCNMANNTTTQEQIVVHGALPGLISMAQDASDVESQRQALLTLSNLASNEMNHSSMMGKQIMKVLTDAFESADADVREYAAFTLANIAAYPDYTALVGRNGDIPPLIQLSKFASINEVCLGLAALRRMANAEENWAKLIQAGMLDSLANAGNSTELEIVREIVAALCSLSLSHPHRVEIAYKCIRCMIQVRKLILTLGCFVSASILTRCSCPQVITWTWQGSLWVL